MKRKALGKGLSALLPDPEAVAATARVDATRQLRLDQLEAESLPAADGHGARAGCRSWPRPSARAACVQPILVRRRGGRYQIIAGERRWRAAQKLGPRHGARGRPRRARRPPASSWPSSRTSSARSCRPLEEAQAFQRLQRRVPAHPGGGARAGRPRPLDRRATRCASLRLPAEVRRAARGRAASTPATPGRSSPLERAEDQIALGREAARKGSPVREVERRGGTPARAAPARPPARDRQHAARPRSGCAPPSARGCQIARRGKAARCAIAVRQRGRAAAALRAAAARGTRTSAGVRRSLEARARERRRAWGPRGLSGAFRERGAR